MRGLTAWARVHALCAKACDWRRQTAHLHYLLSAPTFVCAGRKEKTTPYGVNLMRSQVLYRAAQGLKGIKFTSARPSVPVCAGTSG